MLILKGDYKIVERVFLFGSDLAAIKMHPSFNHEINRNSLGIYLRHNCIGGENSIYAGIYKLIPGSIAKVTTFGGKTNIKAWYSLTETVERCVKTRFKGSRSEAIEALEKKLKSSIKQQMISDVPIGAFLSGGVDSATIVALMQACSDKPVKTFSIGFNEKAKLCGNMLIDEGAANCIHFGFGSNSTVGGKNEVSFHLDFIVKNADVFLDSKLIIKKGKPLI